MDIAAEETCRIQARFRKVTIHQTPFPWRGRPFSKVITTEAPPEAAALQVSCLPAEVLQLLLDNKRTVNEARLGNDQVTCGHAEDQRAAAERQAWPKKTNNTSPPFKPLPHNLRVFKIDLRQSSIP